MILSIHSTGKGKYWLGLTGQRRDGTTTRSFVRNDMITSLKKAKIALTAVESAIENLPARLQKIPAHWVLRHTPDQLLSFRASVVYKRSLWTYDTPIEDSAQLNQEAWWAQLDKDKAYQQEMTQ